MLEILKVTKIKWLICFATPTERRHITECHCRHHQRVAYEPRVWLAVTASDGRIKLSNREHRSFCKVTLQLLSIFSPNDDRFSKLFSLSHSVEICNNVVIKYLTTPQLRRYTTLRNINVKTSNNRQQTFFKWRRHFRSRWITEYRVKLVFLNIWPVKRCVCVAPFWLSRHTSSSTVVTFSSVHASFSLPLLCFWPLHPVS